jgi:hypothetical protein
VLDAFNLGRLVFDGVLFNAGFKSGMLVNDEWFLSNEGTCLGLSNGSDFTENNHISCYQLPSILFE